MPQPEHRPLKILQVVPRYAPAWAFGGGVRITYELAKAWVASGHEVTVFTSDESGNQIPCRPYENIGGISVNRFPVAGHVFARKFPFLFFRPRGMKKALSARMREFDVVHVAESRGPHNRWVLSAPRAARPPVAWSAFGGLADGLGARRVYRRLHDVFYRTARLVQSADKLLAQTAHEGEIYRAFGARDTQIELMPLAVSLADVDRAQFPRGAFRIKHGIPPDVELVTFLGRIHWTKGLHLLIPAVAQLCASRSRARLAIVGWDQGFAREAHRLVRDHGITERVYFTGPVFGDERFSVYRDADVFALTPDIYEETSLAALEACATGTPCVITKQCEIPGLSESGGGLIVDANSQAIARALAQVLSEGGRSTWGPLASALCKSRFTVDVVAQGHVNLFTSMVASR